MIINILLYILTFFSYSNLYLISEFGMLSWQITNNKQYQYKLRNNHYTELLAREYPHT
jgi:hypothetical protein